MKNIENIKGILRYRYVFCMVVLVNLLLPLMFSEYRKEVSVIVISKDNYAVPNAYVYFTNQLNYIDGKITSRPLLTNESGMVSHILYNNDFDLSKMDTKFTVNVVYGGASKSFNGDVNKTSMPMVLQMPLYGVRFKVIDEKGLPAVGAFIEAKNLRFVTDNAGFVFAILPEGKQTVSVIYRGIKKTDDIDVKSGATYTFSIREYKSTVYFIDSFGNPISGTLSIWGNDYVVPDTGLKISYGDDQNPAVNASVSGKTKSTYLFLENDKNSTIVFDIERPVIENVSTYFSDNVFTVKANIYDPGKYASGIKNTYLLYETENEEGKISMYVDKVNSYTGQVRFKSNKTNFIDFTISVQDKEGNSDSFEGSYTVQQIGVGQDQQQSNQQQQAKNQSEKPKPTSTTQQGSVGTTSGSQQQSNIFVVIGIMIIIVVIAYFAYNKFIKKQ